MKFDFYFRGLESMADVRELTGFLASQDLGYPRYDSWVQKTEHELAAGYKGAVMCFSFGKLAGDLVYQPHKSIPRFLEIKNARVDSRVGWRNVGSFMFKQVEVEARKHAVQAKSK